MIGIRPGNSLGTTAKVLGQRKLDRVSLFSANLACCFEGINRAGCFGFNRDLWWSSTHVEDSLKSCRPPLQLFSSLQCGLCVYRGLDLLGFFYNSSLLSPLINPTSLLRIDYLADNADSTNVRTLSMLVPNRYDSELNIEIFVIKDDTDRRPHVPNLAMSILGCCGF